MGGVNVALAGQNRTGVVNGTNYVLAGNTNIGDVTLSGAWSKNTGDVVGNGYTIGASTPIAGALSGGVQYFKATESASGNQTSLSLKYTLSKATYGYLNYSQFSVASSGILAANDNGNFDTGSAGETKRLIALGVAHSF
jgi:hypothetical protein